LIDSITETAVQFNEACMANKQQYKWFCFLTIMLIFFHIIQHQQHFTRCRGENILYCSDSNNYNHFIQITEMKIVFLSYKVSKSG